MAENPQDPAQGQGAQRAPKYNASMIDPEHLKKFNLSIELLHNMGHLEQMLRGGKTNDLIPVTMVIDGIVVRTDARLSFRPTAEGPVKLNLNIRFLATANFML